MNQTDFGKLRANSSADGTNMIRATDCDTPGTVCQDQDAYTAVTGDYFTGFTYTDGTATVVTTGLSILLSTANLDDIHDALLAVIGIYEVDPYISVTEASGVYTVTHIGAGTLSAWVVTSGSQALARSCTTTDVCDFIGIDEGTVTLGDGTSTETIGTHSYTVGDAAANTAEAATYKTNTETALTALAVTGTTVTVDVNDIAQSFTLTITAPIANNLYLTGVQMTKQNCRVEFS